MTTRCASTCVRARCRRAPTPKRSRADTRPFVTYWFPLTADLTVRGQNSLDLRLERSDPAAQEAAVVEEVEVYVIPRVRS